MSGDDPILGRYLDRIDAARTSKLRGRVREVTGIVVKAAVPEGAVGDLVRIETRDGHRLAEIVGFARDMAILMPLGPVEGIGPDSSVDVTSKRFQISVGHDLLGRVVNGLGEPIDDGPPIGGIPWPVQRSAPSPMARPRIERPLSLGVRAIDGLLTVGEGQRVGLFAGSGVGKSSLLGQIARESDADVCLVCLVGERGREVRDFIEDVLGSDGLERSVVVCATSDEPSLVRLKAAWTATAIAEWFRDQGHRVLVLMDSVTRFARAQREVGLAAGEPPARRGYPPSVFGQLPRLLERAGTSSNGSITALYTVLVAGGDMDEPIADEVRGILDGHILLSRTLANRNHWPAIDVLPSLSRVMNSIVPADHRESAGRVRELLAAYEAHRDLISLGAYEYGTDPRVDESIDRIDEIEAFLRQRQDEHSPLEEAVDWLHDIAR